MRKFIAFGVCGGAVALAAVLRYRQIESWYWVTQLVAATWLFTGIWFGRVNLGRTHEQLVKDELRRVNRWSPLSRVLIWGGCWLTVLGIVLHFVTE